MTKTIRLGTRAVPGETDLLTLAARCHFCRPLLAGLATLALGQADPG
jgi:hypothetical protein